MYSTQAASSLSDAALLVELAACAEARRAADARAAEIAGEIKLRSDRALGYSGLAQGRGARTAEVLVQQITGLSRTEAVAVVRVGSRPAFLEALEPGQIGVAKVNAVRNGLGEVTDGVSADDLKTAAEHLAAEAPHVAVEELAARARAARDDLDAQNAERRSAQQHERRYLSITARADGMYNLHGLLDQEPAMILKAALDSIIAPRRGGPRFVDKAKAAEQERIAVEDQRTVPQMALDALVDLVQVAIATPDGEVLTGKKAHVTMHTVLADDGSMEGGQFEGGLDAMSAATLERYLCNSESSVVGFEYGHPVDSSSDQRLFSRAQRRALGAMWGGCGFPGCDRPPSWTEAHHINHWASGHHRSETVDGVLLCRHHHMLLHNNGWRITREGTNYWLHAPDGTVVRLESKSALYRRHQGGSRREQSQRSELAAV